MGCSGTTVAQDVLVQQHEQQSPSTVHVGVKRKCSTEDRVKIRVDSAYRLKKAIDGDTCSGSSRPRQRPALTPPLPAPSPQTPILRLCGDAFGDDDRGGARASSTPPAKTPSSSSSPAPRECPPSEQPSDTCPSRQTENAAADEAVTPSTPVVQTDELLPSPERRPRRKRNFSCSWLLGAGPEGGGSLQLWDMCRRDVLLLRDQSVGPSAAAPRHGDHHQTPVHCIAATTSFAISCGIVAHLWRLPASTAGLQADVDGSGHILHRPIFTFPAAPGIGSMTNCACTVGGCGDGDPHRFAFSGGRSGRVTLVEVKDEDEADGVDVSVVAELSVGSTVPALAPFGRRPSSVVCASERSLFVYDIKKMMPIIEMKGHSQRIVDVASAASSGVMASCAFDRTARLWSESDGSLIGSLRVAEDRRPVSVIPSQSGTRLLVALRSGRFALFDLRKGFSEATKPLLRRRAHRSDQITAARLGESLFITSSLEEDVRIWDFEGNDLFKFERGGGKRGPGMCFVGTAPKWLTE